MAVYPDDIIRRALIYIGTPYVYGAEAGIHDAQPRALDCSELVQIVFNHCGIKLPDGARYQVASSLVKPISVDEALKTKGALLFHRSPFGHRIDHVGISDGKGGVIEATPPQTRHKNPTRKGAWFTGRLVKGVHYK